MRHHQTILSLLTSTAVVVGLLANPASGDPGDRNGVLIDGERVELHTVERHPAPTADTTPEVPIWFIDIGPEPTPMPDPEPDPSSLATFDTPEPISELGNLILDAVARGVEIKLVFDPVHPFGPLPDPALPVPENSDPDDPEDLGDGDYIQ